MSKRIEKILVNCLVNFLESGEIEVRKCDVCGSYMIEGYCIEDGERHYCSDECMTSEMTIEEYNELYNDGEGGSYFTTWEEDINEYNTIKNILEEFKAIKGRGVEGLNLK